MGEPEITVVPESPVDEQDERTAEFYGRTFKANPDVSAWDTMEFFAMLRDAAEDPEGMNPATALVSLRDFAVETVHPDDRPAFRAHARKNRATEDALLEFLGLKVEVDAERPTERSGDSSPGPTSIEQNSASSSGGKDSPLTGLALVRQRPDLAPFLDQAAKAG